MARAEAGGSPPRLSFASSGGAGSDQVLWHVRERFVDFVPTLANETLEESHGLKVSVETRARARNGATSLAPMLRVSSSAWRIDDPAACSRRSWPSVSLLQHRRPVLACVRPPAAAPRRLPHHRFRMHADSGWLGGRASLRVQVRLAARGRALSRGGRARASSHATDRAIATRRPRRELKQTARRRSSRSSPAPSGVRLLAMECGRVPWGVPLAGVLLVSALGSAVVAPSAHAQAGSSRTLVRYRAALGPYLVAIPPGAVGDEVRRIQHDEGIVVRDERAALAEISFAGTARAPRSGVAYRLVDFAVRELTATVLAPQDAALAARLRALEPVTSDRRAREALVALAVPISRAAFARAARETEARNSVVRTSPVRTEAGQILWHATQHRELVIAVLECLLRQLGRGPGHDLVDGMLSLIAPHDDAPPRTEILDLLVRYLRETAEWARAPGR